MKVLITTSRMPCAIEEIRKLGKAGHSVLASDTFASAPGNHSRYVSRAFVTPSPRHQSDLFAAEIAAIVQREGVDLVLPGFEEVFYLARAGSALPDSVRFFPPMPTLRMLHDKAAFARLASSLGLRTPACTVVESREELAAAVAQTPRWFAKPVYTRGGVELYSNAGKLACSTDIDDAEPSPGRPFVVQEFIEGEDVCTFSVVQRGRITAHTTYLHPREIDHSGGIVFESVDIPEGLDIAQRVAAACQYHGQMSLDLIRTEAGLVVIECNPRPTAGVHMMPDEMFEAALLDTEARELRVTPEGIRRKYVFALLRDMVMHFREAREDAKHLLSDAKEVVADPDDLMPGIYQVLSYSRVLAYRKQLNIRANKPTDLKAAYFEDVSYCPEDEDPHDRLLPLTREQALSAMATR